MKKRKVLIFLMLLGIVSIFSMTKADAAGWKSTLNLPYGTVYTARFREYGAGTYRITISVDGFNTADGTVRESGSTTMEIALGDVVTGHILKYDTTNYVHGTCQNRIMGTYSAGYKYYIFFSSIYNKSTGGRDYYDGVISNEVYMYPLPD